MEIIIAIQLSLEEDTVHDEKVKVIFIQTEFVLIRTGFSNSNYRYSRNIFGMHEISNNIHLASLVVVIQAENRNWGERSIEQNFRADGSIPLNHGGENKPPTHPRAGCGIKRDNDRP